MKTETKYFVQPYAKKGKKVRMAYMVKAKGNARPVGKVYRQGVLPLQAHAPTRCAASARATPDRSFRLKSLGSFSKRGMYATTITFVPKKGSVYKSSSSGPRYFYVK